MTPPLPSPCDGFAQDVVLRADRELGPAEAAALEAHLASCPTCRRRSAHLEALASVLKRWDAETHQPVEPPARLAGAILAEIRETADHRRREERRYRALRWVEAASVAAAIALAVLAGAHSGSDRPLADGTASVSIPPAAPRLAWSPLPAGAPSASPPAAPAPGPAAAFPDLPAAVAPPPPALREAAAEALVPVLARALRTRRFEEAYGEPGTWFLRADGQEVLLTVRAAQYLSERDLLSGLARRASGHVYAPPASRTETATKPADVLPFPRAEMDLAAWLPRLAFEAWPTLPVLVAEVPPSAEPGLLPASATERVLDAEAAVAAGVLAFREGETAEEVIALARGNRAPIYLPAGEILVGGERDRVVARGTWIPAAEDRRATLVPCAPVSTARSRRGAQPLPLGVVAGPGLRGLLAQGATGDRVLALAREQAEAAGFRGPDVSLADVFGQVSVRRAAKERARLFPRVVAGIAVLARDGSLLGVEVAGVADRDASALFSRLLAGYDVEAQLRERLRAAGPGAPTPAAAPAGGTTDAGGGDLFTVLAEWMREARGLDLVAEEGGARVMRLCSARGGFALEAVETGGRPRFASLLRGW